MGMVEIVIVNERRSKIIMLHLLFINIEAKKVSRFRYLRVTAKSVLLPIVCSLLQMSLIFIFQFYGLVIS